MSSYIKADTIQAIAHSVDIPKLTPDAAKALAPDVEYRMREVVQVRVRIERVLPALPWRGWWLRGRRCRRSGGRALPPTPPRGAQH
jgi:hypothetical protein